MDMLLMKNMNNIDQVDDYTEKIAKQGAILSLIEIGLGSFLHSLKIPLTGHVLSINQIAFLSRSSFHLKSHKASLELSLIASLLKSLSPAGKKLTPMLAIAAQGLFYYLGLFFFGINYIGLLVAVSMSSLWAFFQPVLFIYILFGKNSIAVAEYFLREFEKYIPHSEEFIIKILLLLILLKITIAFIFSLTAIKMTESSFVKYQNKMLLEIKSKPTTKTPSINSHAYMAFKDLFTPLFLISFLLTIVFFIFSQSASITQIIWLILRPLAIGFIVFYLIRIYPAENLSAFIKRKGFTQLSKALDVAIKVVRENRGF